MHPIPEVFNASGEPIHGIVPPSLVKIVGPKVVVWGIAGKHMKDTLHDRVRDGDDGPLFPTAGGKALIQRR